MVLRISQLARAAGSCLLALAMAAILNGVMKADTRPKAATTCGNAPVISSDGAAIGEDFLLLASTNYYTLNVMGGHSYSVEVLDTLDPTYGFAPAIRVVDADCDGNGALTDVTRVDPNLSGGFSSRVSWIQDSDATIHLGIMNPDQDNSYTYSIRVTDTTLFNPRWTTYSGFSTQWGFTNTTASDLVGNLTIVDVDGTVLKTVTDAVIKAGVTTFFYSSSLGLPLEHVGSAIFTYAGPPGAILADAYYLNGNASIVVPALFVGKHSYH